MKILGISVWIVDLTTAAVETVLVFGVLFMLIDNPVSRYAYWNESPPIPKQASQWQIEHNGEWMSLNETSGCSGGLQDRVHAVFWTPSTIPMGLFVLATFMSWVDGSSTVYEFRNAIEEFFHKIIIAAILSVIAIVGIGVTANAAETSFTAGVIIIGLVPYMGLQAIKRKFDPKLWFALHGFIVLGLLGLAWGTGYAVALHGGAAHFSSVTFPDRPVRMNDIEETGKRHVMTVLGSSRLPQECEYQALVRLDTAGEGRQLWALGANDASIVRARFSGNTWEPKPLEDIAIRVPWLEIHAWWIVFGSASLRALAAAVEHCWCS